MNIISCRLSPGLILFSQGVLGGFINGGAVSKGDYECRKLPLISSGPTYLRREVL